MGIIESLDLEERELVTELVATVGRLGPVSGFLLTNRRIIFPHAINASFQAFSNSPDVRDLLSLKDFLDCVGGLMTVQTKSLLD
jgi:hypothetical protein